MRWISLGVEFLELVKSKPTIFTRYSMSTQQQTMIKVGKLTSPPLVCSFVYAIEIARRRFSRVDEVQAYNVHQKQCEHLAEGRDRGRQSHFGNISLLFRRF